MTSPAEPLRPFDAIMLSVGDGHWLYAEQVGTPGGTPVLFLHGGPGSGAQHAHRALFDPARHHAILFDQRGSGRSHPYLSLTANSTAHLVSDIERLRSFFGFDKMLIIGGSWGSTLALAYAEAHPERVAGLVLRAVFLGTDAEIAWAFVDGPKQHRPALYESFVAFLPKGEQHDPIRAYVARLTHPDAAIHAPAAHMWNAYERALSEIALETARLPQRFDPAGRVPPTPLMEAHYIKHHFFLEPGQLLAQAHRLGGIPGYIVQGRHDLLCPPVNAVALHAAWPDSQLQIIETAGHAMTEPGIEPALKAALLDLSR